MRLAIAATARSAGRITVRGPGVGVARKFRLGRSRPRAVAIDRQQLPDAGHATQLDAAAVLEARTRADHQVTHGARDEDLAGAGLPADPRRNVYGDPPMSVSSSSHSPVWMPARISIPNVSASARNASAQRVACVGPSNVAR